jgi:hypothetical protein
LRRFERIYLEIQTAEARGWGGSAFEVTPGEVAGLEGSTCPLLDPEDRVRVARAIAAEELKVFAPIPEWAPELLAGQVERVYLAMYAFCCRTEVLARKAAEHPGDRLLGALFGLLVSSAVRVVAEIEAFEALAVIAGWRRGQ